MERKMKISIALATYNGGKYLQDQLDSFLNQERIPDEIVVCDDASNDETLAMLDAFQKVSPFEVKVFKNETNIGYTKNFEKALSLCTGDIVFFSDQDDVWLPNKISIIENLFNDKPNASVIIHDAELVNEALDSTGLTKLGQIHSGGYTDKDFVTGTLSAIHKDILNIVLPFPDGIACGHDGWVHTISGLVGRRIIIRDVLQKLRRHSSNTSEWVVNSMKKINKIDVLLSQFSTSVADSYEDRLLINESLSLRFNEIKSRKIHCSFHIDVEQIDKKLKTENSALVKRQELLSYNFFGRKIHAFLILFSGDYRHFNGIKSFARDFIR